MDTAANYWDHAASQKKFTHPFDDSLFGRYADKRAHIVDYGCGYGRIVRELLAAGYTDVRGFDTSEKLIERGIAEGCSNISYVANDTQMPVADGSVDAFILFAVLTCIPVNKDQSSVIGSLYKKLKPGGIIYVSDYYLQDDLTEVRNYVALNGDQNNFGVFSTADGAVFRHHERNYLLQLFGSFTLLEENNIEVLTMNGHPAKAIQLIFRK